MRLNTFKRKLNLIGLHVYKSHHHSWVVSLQHDIPHSRISKEVVCAEISTQFRSYYVNRPQYLSKTVILMIHALASTPPDERDDDETYFVLCSRIDKSYVKAWFINPQGKIMSDVSHRDLHYLTKPQLINVENYLLNHGFGKKSLIIKTIRK